MANVSIVMESAYINDQLPAQHKVPQSPLKYNLHHCIRLIHPLLSLTEETTDTTLKGVIQCQLTHNCGLFPHHVMDFLKETKITS